MRSAPPNVPRPTRLLPLALLALLAAVPAAAQQEDSDRTVAGTVVDAATGVPVSGARVALADGERGAFADAQGRFSLRRMGTGAHAVVVTQIGYDSLRTVLQVGEGMEPLVLRLSPDPVVLEGIQVVSDRIRRRRNAVATSVNAFDQRALRTSPIGTVWDFVRARANLTPVSCPGRLAMDPCAYVRGRPTQVAVYVDDARMAGGMDVMHAYRPEELYLVEVYSGGRQVRLYTNWYIERAAKNRVLPAPILF